MGTGGGGGGGKKGGNGSKRPPEDKVDIENHPSEGDEDDSSSEPLLNWIWIHNNWLQSDLIDLY